ncbi:hypothetical protein NMG60_11015068 [Bertholletia excelsa]
MEEEFQESDVIFSENSISEEHCGVDCGCSIQSNPRISRSSKLDRKNKKDAVPLNIPERDRWARSLESDFFNDGELVPPHLIVGQRIFAGKMAFSVCTGNGRTLKGRDLSEVRNSILRLTGFLES